MEVILIGRNSLYKAKVFIVIFCLFYVPFSISKEINISAGIFMGIIESNGSGPYQLILKEAAKRAGIEYSEQVYPLQRAIKTFTARKVLAIYGMTEAVISEIGEEKILTSYPLGIYKVHIFTKKGQPVISNFKQLENKVVGGINGYQQYYQELTKNKVKISYFTHEHSQMDRLNLGRIDTIVGFLPDWLEHSDTLDYDPQFPIYVGYDYMTVWNTPQGQDFVNKISLALQRMKSDGSLKKVLGDRYMEFNYTPTRKFEWTPKAEAPAQ